MPASEILLYSDDASFSSIIKKIKYAAFPFKLLSYMSKVKILLHADEILCGITTCPLKQKGIHYLL